MFKRIERIANVIVICLALLLGIAVAWRYFTKSPVYSPVQLQTLGPGSIIDLDRLRSTASAVAKRPNLIIAASTKCRYCEDNIDAYRSLVSFSAAQKGMKPEKVLVLLPDKKSEAETWLKQQGLAVPFLADFRLAQIGIYGTPTLLLVSEKGRVLRIWQGRLSSEQQRDILESIETLM